MAIQDEIVCDTRLKPFIFMYSLYSMQALKLHARDSEAYSLGNEIPQVGVDSITAGWLLLI